MSKNAKDEQKYVEELRREEPIKTEVIAELKENQRLLVEEQKSLLTMLINTTELLIMSQRSLNAYRRMRLETLERQEMNKSSCVSGCTRHTWSSTDGWHGAKKPC